jgi:hypothetical protein
VWVGLLLPAVGIAQVDVEAEHRRGLAFREQGRHAEAAAVFRALYESMRESRALVRLTLAEAAALVEAMERSPVAAFRWAIADEHMQTAMSLSSDPYLRTPAVRDALRQTQRELQRRLGFLEVACNAPGAEVWAGTTRIAQLPLQHALRAPIGRYSLTVRAPGHEPRSVPVSVQPGVIAVVEATLSPSSTAPVVAPGPAESPAEPRAATPVMAAPSLTPGVQPEPTAPGGQGVAPLRIVGWSLVGLGAVAGAVGVVQWIVSAQNVSALREATAASEGAPGAWARFNGEINASGSLSAEAVCTRAADNGAGAQSADARTVAELCATSATRDALALGFGLGGVALVVAGALVLGTAPRPVHHRQTAALPRLHPWAPRSATHGLSLSWSF